MAALEDSGRSLCDLQALYRAVASTASVGEMPTVVQQLAPLVPALEVEIAHDPALFARIDAVWRTRHASGLDAEQVRLVEVLHERMVHAGAALAPEAKSRLQLIHARLATLSSQLNQNLIAEQAAQAVWLETEDDLAGRSQAQRQSAAVAATVLGRDGSDKGRLLGPR